MRTIINSCFTTLIVVLFLSACNVQPGQSEVNLNLKLSSYQSQVNIRPLFTADQLLQGQLQATNTATLIVETFDWSIYVDETTLEVQSNQNIILTPGIYDFSFLVSNGTQQYAGQTLAQTIVDGTNDIAMTLSPIIGNSVSDVSVIGNLADFKFQVPTAQLATVSAPSLGVTVDGGVEQVFSINLATGLTDAYINLPEGAHTVQLALYDGSLQIGRSVPEQESIVIIAGVNVALDIVALAAESNFALSIDGGNLDLTINIPAAVVDEAGGVADTYAFLSLNGTLSGLHETELVLNPSGSEYIATVNLSPMYYESISMAVVFSDKNGGTDPATFEQIGSCAQSIILDAAGTTALCEVTLRRRAIISSNLLATIGLNVKDAVGQPIAGAEVKLDGTLVGITGSGSYGQAGYLKFYVVPGSHTLRAEASGNYGELTINPAPLAIENVQLVAGTPIVTGPGPVTATIVYVPSMIPQSISAYQIDSASGLLTAVDTETLSFQPWKVATPSDGRYLVAGSLSSDQLKVYRIDETTGALTDTGQSTTTYCSARDMAFNNDNKILAVVHGTCGGGTRVSMYTLDYDTGALIEAPGSPFIVGVNPDLLAWHHTANTFYIATDNGIVTANVLADGAIALTIPPSVGDSGDISSLTYHPSTSVLYATVEFSDALRVYNFTVGQPPIITQLATGGVRPIDSVVDASGSYLYTADFITGSVSQFGLDITGTLPVLSNSFAVAPSVRAVATSGSYLYAGDQNSGDLYGYDTNVMTSIPGLPISGPSTPIHLHIVNGSP